MRLTSGTYGAAGSTYQTEIADFSNVTANGAAGNGPAYFTVQGRNGLTYEYGYTDANGNGANSQVLASGTSTASEWLLSKVIDRAGNNYVINYTMMTGTAVPHTILWTATSAGASSYTYTMTFNYTTNAPQSSIYAYLAGSLVSNTDLLSSIAISYNSAVIRDYFLGYQISSTTGRDELNTIKECADSGQSDCLLPTTVGYTSGSAGVSTTVMTAVTSTGSGLTARYDLNGDGYPDLVYVNGSGQIVVAFGSAGGYGTPYNTGITGGTPLIGHLARVSQDGFLAINGSTWWYYTWNGTSFTGTSTGIAYDSTAVGYQLADVDGDGLADLVVMYVTYIPTKNVSVLTIDTRHNTSTGSSASFSSTLTQAYSLRPVAGAQLLPPDQQMGKLRRYDFNGDGRDDLAVEITTGTAPNYTNSTYELLSTGTAFTPVLIASVFGGYANAFFVNWNDDKCTDFASLGTLYVSGCNGTVPKTYSVGTVLGALDWDGDGRTDLIVQNGSTLGIYPSTGSGVGSLIATSIPYVSTCQYVTMDANGDGLDDLGCWGETGSSPVTYYLHNGTSDLANSFADGYGVQYAPSYVPLSDSGGVYTKGSSAVFPDQDYAGPLYVVSSFRGSDGIGSNYTISYDYFGAIMNLQGRGFEGFNEIQSIDSRTGNNTFAYHSTVFPKTGMLSGYELTQSTATKVIRLFTPHVSVVTLDGTTNNERYFPYDDTRTVNDYEVGGADNGLLITATTTTYNSPDNYGNFANIGTTVTDEDSSSPYYTDQWTSTTANTITPYPSTWCVNLPTETTVTNSSTAAGSGSAIMRTQSFTPDYTYCRETEQIVEPSSATYKVTSDFTYDGFGNLYTEKVTGVSMAQRTVTLNWGTTGQFLTTITNPLSQTVTLAYDPGSGMLTSEKDPNNITTSWQYDGFARKNKETRPDGTSTTWGYNNCTTAGCVNGNNKMSVTQTVVNVGGTAQSVHNSYFDWYDRVLVSSGTMLNGAYDRNEVQYDNLGNVHQQAAPCTYVSCTTYWTTNTYDVLNRLVQSQRPISATNPSLQTATHTYQGRTSTVTDALGHTTTKVTQVTGALGRTQGANGYYETFTYDAFGSLLSVTDSASPANTLFTSQYAYGLAAFRTSATDMDSGARSYTVDALGEVTSYTDAKNQPFSITYDALSRPWVRTEPDLTTTWTWGTSAGSHNIGKLQSVTASG